MQRITFILMACLGLLILTAGFAAADKIMVRSDLWPPYNDEPGSAKPGYMIEVLQEIFSAQKIEIDYQVMPWSDSLETVKKGDFDAVVGTDPEEATDFIFPEESFGKYQNGFYVKKEIPWRYKGTDSLKQVRLGVIEGYDYGGEVGKYLESHAATNKVITINDENALPQLLGMLKDSRIDAVVDNIPVIKYTLRAENFEPGEVVFAGTDTISATDLFVAFSPAKTSSKEYAKIFDEGIKQLRSSGKLREILARYGLEDWK